MKTKRMPALIGCGLLLLVAGAAFGEGQDEVDRLSFGNDETLDLVWGGYSGTEITDDNWVKTHVEELFNVQITNTIMHGGRQEALNTMIAAANIRTCCGASSTWWRGSTRAPSARSRAT